MIPTRQYFKGKKEPLNDDKTLWSHEVACSCFWKHCQYTLITERLIDAFSKTRRDFGKRIFVTSGYRCHQKNKLTPNSSEISNHMYGDAIDMTPFEGSLDDLEELAKIHFKKVIRYETFIHCDMRANQGED